VAKVNAQVVNLWSKVLHAVPQSRLLLRAPTGEPRSRLAQAFRAAGIDTQRVEFLAFQPRASYLDTYSRIDVCLDTFPSNGHTTSLDAQWMGVPVITRVGKIIGGRAGLCQARNLDLSFLIAEDDAAFVRIAGELASDLPKLVALRAGLRQRMEGSPLMDAPRFARHLEQAFRIAWHRFCDAEESAGQRPHGAQHARDPRPPQTHV
jgi:predicted O-linked N-acetylglucosamine transferase (SPINDLY family)